MGRTYCGGVTYNSSGAVTECGYLYLNNAKSDIREPDTGGSETYESWAWYDRYPWGQHPDDPAPEPEEPNPEENSQPDGEEGQDGEEEQECIEGEECLEECLEGEDCDIDEWSLSLRIQATAFSAVAMVIINI